MSFKRFDNQSVRQSNLGFLQIPQDNHRVTNIRGTADRVPAFTEDIFLKSINTSNIGKISGQVRPITILDYEQILPPVDEEREQEKPNHKRRINFSTFKGVPTDRIINPTDQRIIKPTESRIMSPRSDMKSEHQDKIMAEELKDLDNETLILVSFEGKQKKDLLHDNGCMFCQTGGRQRCKLRMQNQSTLEIYIPSEEGKKVKYEQLFLSINFDTIEVEINYSPKHNNKQLALVAGQYRLLLEHHSADVIKDRFQQLEDMRKQGKGTEFHLTRLLSNDAFYMRRYETEQFFTKHCETGDVLLFEDTHFFAKAQRFFTRSDFDHVAVAVKDYHYGLLMFESMSGGVALTPWRSVIRQGWFENIPRITWRRLNADKDKNFDATVQKFVKDNIEKNYHISFAKLTANVSMVHDPAPSTDNKGEKEEQGFFCSELVATLYKELGLLTRDTSSPNYQPACKFYPKDFSVKGRKLDVGELSPEYDIFFDKKLLKLNYKHIKAD